MPVRMPSLPGRLDHWSVLIAIVAGSFAIAKDAPTVFVDWYDECQKRRERKETSRRMELDKTVLAELKVVGFVSLGRADGSSSYFLHLGTGVPAGTSGRMPEVGDVIQPRIGSNVRLNRLHPDNEASKIVYGVSKDGCVEVSGPPKVFYELHWVPVKKMDRCALDA